MVIVVEETFPTWSLSKEIMYCVIYVPYIFYKEQMTR